MGVKTALYLVIAAREARYDKLQTRKRFPPIIQTLFSFSMLQITVATLWAI